MSQLYAFITPVDFTDSIPNYVRFGVWINIDTKFKLLR